MALDQLKIIAAFAWWNPGHALKYRYLKDTLDKM